MTLISSLLRATAIGALVAASAVVAQAKDVTISVWSGGSGPLDNYRTDAKPMCVP